MIQRLDVLLGPAEITQVKSSAFEKSTCVVFDILRFTSTAVMALEHGAIALLAAESIEAALNFKKTKYSRGLLAGERQGDKIRSNLTGGIEFDLGNSPREFTRQALEGRLVISTTTNGTLALNACKGALQVMAASFLNLSAGVKWLLAHPTEQVWLVCSGTHEENSYEDMLGAGAFASLLIREIEKTTEKIPSFSDSVLCCMELFRQAEREGLESHFRHSRNGRNLLRYHALQEDVAFCAQRDLCHFAVLMDKEGLLRSFLV